VNVEIRSSNHRREGTGIKDARKLSSHLNLAELAHRLEEFDQLHLLPMLVKSRIRSATSHYFPDQLAFHQLLEQTGAVVSGSTALYVATGGTFTPGDIDLLVDTQHVQECVDFLVGQGYHKITVPSNSYYYYRRRKSDFGLRRFVIGIGDRKIDLLIAPEGLIATDLISNYHSTCVMNAITACSA
jgi:hypothetical protein